MRVLTAILLAGLGWADARADALEFDLGSAQYLDRDSSTGLWNAPAGRIQAQVSPDLDGSGEGDAGNELDFGDGSDGEFADGPAGTGISVSGSTITIDSDVKDEFEFSSFTLSSGKTLRVSGSNPVVIRVFGFTLIDGTVDAAGEGGGPNSLSGAPSGGSGVAGGGDGGAGAGIGDAFGVDGTAGGAAGDFGGRGASDATTLQYEGGGGGCFGDDGVFDSDDGANAANRGTCASNPNVIAPAFETTFHGGSGGGGGGAHLGNVAGSGAGGGGGAIRFVSLGAVRLTGDVTVEGGEGGAVDTGDGTDCGGGGGGGSGGAVWVQSAGAVSGPGGGVSVEGGSGGTGDTCGGTTFEGGEGSRGVFRVDDPSGSISGITISPSGATDGEFEVLALPGQAYEVVSTGIEVFPAEGIFDYEEPTETAGCGSDGDVSVTYQGSDDGVTFGAALPGSRLSELSDRRYVRFRVQIDTTGGSPPCLSGLTFNYVPRVLSDLTLSGGLFFCGTVGGGGSGLLPPPRAWGDAAVFALALALAWTKGRRRQPRFGR